MSPTLWNLVIYSLAATSRSDEQARVVEVNNESAPFVGTTRRRRERLPATNTAPQHVEP